VFPVPFFFRVVNASRFLRQLRILQSSPARRAIATVAALTGAGKAGVSALQFRGLTGVPASSGLSIERVDAWGDWVDELWEKCRPGYSFAVSRDLRTVRALYPPGERIRSYLVRRGGRPEGWIAALNTPVRNHKHFGNLQVATLLDGIGLPSTVPHAIRLASRELAREGADLLVTNQSHEMWQRAFRAAGYLTSNSNYILALSQELAAGIAAQPGGLARAHFTRGDSDGRIHL
jgi:hypothetical protein